MWEVILGSAHKLNPGDRAEFQIAFGYDPARLKFPGFHSENEAEIIEEFRQGVSPASSYQVFSDRIDAGKEPNLAKYRRMLTVFRQIMGQNKSYPPRLSPQELLELFAARSM